MNECYSVILSKLYPRDRILPTGITWPYTLCNVSPVFPKPAYFQQPLATHSQPWVGHVVAWYGCYDHHSYSCFLSYSVIWLPRLSSSFWFDFASKFTSCTVVNMLAFATMFANAPVVPFHSVVTKFVWLLWIPFLPRSPSLPRFLRLQWLIVLITVPVHTMAAPVIIVTNFTQFLRLPLLQNW